MSKNLWDDEALLKALTGSEMEGEKGLRQIFGNPEWKNLTLRHVREKGGNEQDGEDVFQEAIILFDRNIRENRFKGDSSLKTYFIAIVKWYWWGQLRKRRPQDELTVQHHDSAQESVEARVMEGEKRHFLDEALKQVGDRCRQILKLYSLRYSMEEIAQQVGLSSADMAKKENYRCRLKLKAFFDNNPGWLNLVN